MSSGKIASQVGHVCKRLGWVQEAEMLGADDKYDVIVVLGLRQNKFNEKLKEIEQNVNHNYYVVQKDLGFTEVEEQTITAFGYIEEFYEK